MESCFLLPCLLFVAVQSSLFVEDRQVKNNSSELKVPDLKHHCHPWEYWSSDLEICKCSHSLLETVYCGQQPYSLQLFACYCMTYDEVRDQLLVGSCQLTCKTSRGYFTNITVNTSSEINSVMCSKYNREGQMCGSCKKGYSPPVYSYSLSCVECTSSHWGRYIAVSLLPVTVFYIIVVTFRISATSPMLNGLVVCLQLLLTPPNQRLIASSVAHDPGVRTDVQLSIISIYAIWNLDFCRLVYHPFCIQPDSNILQVLALDYLIALYPLFFIGLSYILVLLYDRNVYIVVCLLKPFIRPFIVFRRQWDIKHSLVDAFATFILLSYVKILSVSVDLLLPVALYDQNEERLTQLYLFNQGDVPYFGKEHLPYACLALFFLVTFTLLPMLLLFLYPCSCFQVCLNRRGWNCQSLHIFMDSFQGHLKDGTNGTRDMRFFSGLYLLLRVIVYVFTVLAYQIASFSYSTAIISVFAISVALARPYKKNIHNVIDTVFLTVLQLLYVTLIPIGFGRFTRLEHGVTLITTILLLIPLQYIVVLLVWKMKTLCFKLKSYLWDNNNRMNTFTSSVDQTGYGSIC